LFVAFHFPPYGGGSGVHRASRFAQYLPEHAWRPYVLTACSRAYERVNTEAPGNALSDATVMSTFALDTQRHLAWRGRYSRLLALPDRWSTWALAAVPKGLFAIYRKKIDLIMATFPIATAVLIGLVLHFCTRKPLVIDFRDSMTEDEYPRDPLTRRVCRRIESWVVRSAALLIFTTESARRMYLNRYPSLSPANCVVIPNGYDEDDFSGAFAQNNAKTFEPKRPVRLVHAGVIYTDDRDPRAFFAALGRLKAEGAVDASNLRIELRASGAEKYYATLLRECGIGDFVHLLPALPHKDAISDIASTDGLVLFQAASCNHQIPAKVYEYFRVGKPVLALTPASGDTGILLSEVGGATVVDLDDENAIYRAVPAFLKSVADRTHPLPDPEKVQKYTRRNQTAELARCLDKLCIEDLGRAGLASGV